MNWERCLGGHTVNFTDCTIPDSVTNRLEAALITRLVADHCGLLDDTDRERARLDGEPVHMKGHYIVARYVGPANDKRLKGISLCAYTWQGNLITSLAESKWRVKRTDAYLRVQETLTTEFKTRLGAQCTIKQYDQGPK